MKVREIMEKHMEHLAEVAADYASAEDLPELTEAMIRMADYLEEKHMQEDDRPMDALVALRMLQNARRKVNVQTR